MSSAYDKLARPLQKWIRMNGWSSLRPIQSDTIHAVMDSSADVIVSAQTAGGKTEAAFLPLISRALENPAETGGFDLVYIGPLKALITDQAMRLDEMCQDMDMPVIPWHGDVSNSIKTRARKTPKGILLITPESLEALFARRGQEIPRLFTATQAIIIDELHNFLDSERGMQMRSLLTRLEIAVKHPIRRIGLSATLGDMNMARAYLRPDAANAVKLVENNDEESELLMQVRGYVSGKKPDEKSEEQKPSSATDTVANHLFDNLRGDNHLVFAGARQSVEIYADHLRRLCEQAHLPLEFYPHHANLSKDHRNFVEKRLKENNLPTTAICTSTLELGIDIGSVKSVAQIGAPFGVASLRQRLGRSGREEGQPQILRQYAIEAQLDSKSNLVDQFRLGLIRTMAIIDLLLEKWYEPPKTDALHLSTLVHQILSVIAEKGGAHANRIHRILCKEGPFRQVDGKTFMEVLKAMGRPETGLIEQSSDGLLLLGAAGERMVEHYSFFAVFKTPEEYRLVAGGRDIGTVPVDNMLSPGMHLIFSGRRWLVNDIHDREKVIMASPAKAGVPPIFGGEPGMIHDRVIDRMFDLLEGNHEPNYMNPTAIELLREARGNFMQWRFSERHVVALKDGSHVIATRCGTEKTTALAMALSASGFEVMQHDGFLSVEPGKAEKSIAQILSEMADGKIPDLFAHSPSLMFEKHHFCLTDDLLQRDALSTRVDAECLRELCSDLQPDRSKPDYNPEQC